MAIQFVLAGSQIDGARDYQEDAFLITHLTDKDGNPSALVIVADGMGGHAAGNVASNMAVQAFNKHVSANYPTDDPAAILKECVLKANHSIQETVKETPALAGMGCTMVAAILEGNKLWWASVGDSHLYLIRNKELLKKNADHSYGGFLDRMAAAGTPVEPEKGLSRNMLMSAVTGDEINELDVPAEPFELQAGDRLLICSDGLDTLSAGKIIQYSEWSESPKECADALMQAVEEAAMPKQDNTTAVVVNIMEKEEEEAPMPEPVPETEPDKPEDTAENEIIQEATPARQEFVVEEEPKKSKTGLIIGIAAVVTIGIAVAAFMMLGGKKSAPVPTAGEVAETGVEEAVVTVAKEKNQTSGQAVEKAAEAVTATKTKTAAKPATTTKAATPAPSTAATPEGKEFHDALKDGTPGPAMVWIPAGEFDMGSPGSSRHKEERPRHHVKIKKFAVSMYEITFAEYDKFAKATGRKQPDNLYMSRDTHPVIFVTWDDAYYYTQWLSEQTGHSYRLLSEAEWEYAAGTGKRSPYWWGYNMEPNMAHCQLGCGSKYDPKKPTEIGSFEPNPFGVYDTNGNVAEWVVDCWHPDYKNAPGNGKVWIGGDCVFRVVRGGSYFSPEDSIRHAKRDKFKSDQTYDHIGIRIARDID
ncbi:MAG: SUMF1/EgtB/PvdO family nonheme iron enzyme [Gammaproteobacteria bacterium]